MDRDDLALLQDRLGYHFSDLRLLERALTHRSRPDSGESYERLEFLGDRVLGLVLADALFAEFQGEDQGDLSSRLHHLAQQNYLAGLARQLDLPRYIRAEKGNQLTERDSILADVVEAILAAVWLEAGWPAAKELVLRLFDWQAEPPAAAEMSPKSALQEYADARALGPVAYRLLAKSGPEHAPFFEVQVQIKKSAPATGTGNSKKAAESAAATALLAQLTGQQDG